VQIEYCSKCGLRLDGKDLQEARAYRTRELLCEECRNAATVKPNRIIPAVHPRSFSPRRSNTNYAIRAARAPRRQTSPGSFPLLIGVLLAVSAGVIAFTVLRTRSTESTYVEPSQDTITDVRESQAAKAYRELTRFQGIPTHEHAKRIKAVEEFLHTFNGTSAALEAHALLKKLKASGEAHYRVNCGGNAQKPFMADAYYSGGETHSAEGKVDLSKAPKPAPETVYHRKRMGRFTYAFPDLTPHRTYRVRLHFSESTFGAPGKRLFDVNGNGAEVLKDVDIFATAGAQNRAVVREATVKADEKGQVLLEFLGSKEHAQCSGIEILEVPSASQKAATGQPQPAATRKELSTKTKSAPHD